MKAHEPITCWELLDRSCALKTSWSISDRLALELAEHLERTRPRRVLEIGSGFSTAILGAYAAAHGAVVVSLEHSARYAQRTSRGLDELGLAGSVDLRYAPLAERSLAGGQSYFWYDLELDGDFDFVFIDGPPKDYGRWGVFFEVVDHLSPGWEMWLDDGNRAHEWKCIKLWTQHGAFLYARRDIDGKGIFILRDARHQKDGQVEHRDRNLGVGILVNGDSSWWRRTQEWVGQGVLENSHVAAATVAATPHELPDAVEKHISRGGRAGRRPARHHTRTLPRKASSPSIRLIGRLLHSAARPSRVEYVLYLNDDWSSRTLDDGWLKRSLEYLEAHHEVDQVLLPHRIGARSTGPAAAPHGMGFIELGARRCRDEPSLIRARRRAARGWRGLLQRRRPWSRMTTVLRLPPKLETVQLSPGVFVKRL